MNECESRNARKFERTDIIHAMREILTEIGEESPWTYPLEAIVERYSRELQAPRGIRGELLDYARELEKGVNTSGWSKRGLTAALIYKFAETDPDEWGRQVTQEEIARACNVSPVALRENLQWISNQISHVIKREFPP